MSHSQAPDLYLASRSPRRRELLTQIGVRFALIDADVPELHQPGEAPDAYVQRLAADKSRAGERQRQAQGLPPAPVLGSDTVVVCDGQILEKPRDQDHALIMLRQLSNREHQVMTAVALSNQVATRLALSVTRVVFRALSDQEILAYWRTGEPQDKAGGYAIQGLGAVFVQTIEGSYSGVVGLPIETTLPLLDQFGVPWWQETAPGSRR